MGRVLHEGRVRRRELLSADYSEGPRPLPGDPTASDIRKRAGVVRTTWDAETELKRRVTKASRFIEIFRVEHLRELES